MILLSPLLAFSTIQSEIHTNFEEDNCCLVDSNEKEEEHSCCIAESDLDFPRECNDNRCHPGNCHLNQISVFSFYVTEFQENDEFLGFFTKKTKFDQYKSLIVENLSNSSWKPPKYIS